MKTKVVALVIIAFILLSVFYLLSSRDYATPPSATNQEAGTAEQQIEQGRESNAAALAPQAAALASSTAEKPFTKTYTEKTYGFSFSYPDSLKIGSFTDPNTGATTITAQDAASHVGFQIVISPWEGGAVTPEAVQRDLPQIRAQDFKTVPLGGASALAFTAEDANFGDSRQVWLVYPEQGRGIRGNLLYQISTYRTQEVLLGKVLTTWRWTR